MNLSKLNLYSGRFNTMSVLLLLSVLYTCIRAYTGSSMSNGRSGVESRILTVHQLINQESMLRLTLDRQVQELRSLVYDLQSKLSQTDERYQNQFRSLETNVYNITETLHEDYVERDKKVNRSYQIVSADISEKFSTLEQNMVDIRMNFSSLQGRISEVEEGSPVYFSAFLTNDRTTQASSEVIKFNYVSVSKGGGYDSSTGTFTCPKTGVYLLSFGYLSGHAKGIHAYMYINDNIAMRAYTPRDAQWNSAERSSAHSLMKGDVVNVVISESGSKLGGGRYTSFSAVNIH